MNLRRHFRYYPSDIKVTWVLLCILVIALIVTLLLDKQYETTGSSLNEKAIDTVSQKSSFLDNGQSKTIYYKQQIRKVERFTFDPNTADSTTLLRLGLRPWQVRNIYRYRAHGGIYRTSSDFARLYGLTQKQFRELEPYIRISDDYKPAANIVKKEQIGHDTIAFPTKMKSNERIALNTADTNQLKRIPGIGSYYARIIYQYGERLGGYVSIDQLDEIEDIPLEIKQYLIISKPTTRKMNINQLTLNQLKRHPYMGFYRAKAITDYKRIHGDIHSLNELRLNKDFTNETIQRLLPYIEY